MEIVLVIIGLLIAYVKGRIDGRKALKKQYDDLFRS